MSLQVIKVNGLAKFSTYITGAGGGASACTKVYLPSRLMRPKARELAQHGGPPGWLEESDPGRCDFVRVGRSMPPVLTDATTCPGIWG